MRALSDLWILRVNGYDFSRDTRRMMANADEVHVTAPFQSMSVAWNLAQKRFSSFSPMTAPIGVLVAVARFEKTAPQFEEV